MISHSHADEYKAVCLTGYLYDVFRVRCFVDSCVWGNANDLLKAIDNEKCYVEDRGVYDYDRRNYSTSHVHMMLSAALLKMIDRTECLFFLKTPNSISATTDKIITKTESPWLYSEILISRLVRKRTPAQHRPDLEKAKAFSESKSLNESAFTMRHEVYTGHLADINEMDVLMWKLVCGQSFHEKYPLDSLYELF